MSKLKGRKSLVVWTAGFGLNRESNERVAAG